MVYDSAVRRACQSHLRLAVNDLSTTILILRLVQLLLAIALLALVGQGIVWILARAVGQKPAQNFFYRVLQVVASPVVKLLRLISPKFVSDRHLPFAAFGLLMGFWLWTTAEIANTCIKHGLPIRECLAGR